jgi:hypothetical protein
VGRADRQLRVADDLDAVEANFVGWPAGAGGRISHADAS